MSQKEQYYDFQPSFNSGEISPDVANRTDLDKFTFCPAESTKLFRETIWGCLSASWD